MMKVVKINKDGDELTRYGFISQTEDYIRQLLSDPIKANISDYLMSHGLNSVDLLKMLLHNPDASDENNAILIRTERIKTDPETGKDKFCVKYKLPRKDYDKKMRKLYIDLFENYQTDNDLLNEEGEGAGIGGGATSCDGSSGQFIQPLTFDSNEDSDNNKKKKKGEKAYELIIRRDFHGMLQENKKKTVIITESQLAALKEAVESTGFGGGFEFGYDAPVFAKEGDPTLDHKNIMAKSFPGNRKKKKKHIN